MTTRADTQSKDSVTVTGITALDGLLGGGLPSNNLYLVQGTPGAGKTTLALQFAMAGAARGETVLYVALSESKQELIGVAHSHGWSLEGINVLELVPPEDELEPDAQYTMFEPAEIELNVTIKNVVEAIERMRPARVVFDSLSELRLLAQSPLRFRRQILALKQFFIGRSCTVLLLDHSHVGGAELHIDSIVHGVINLEQLSPEYGGDRRRLHIRKLRGLKYEGGYHDSVIATGGIKVFPRVSTVESPLKREGDPLSSNNSELDRLLGGGIDRGSSALLMGPAGSGKTSIAALYAANAARNGERSAFFLFDESKEMLLKRSRGLDMDLMPHVDSGLVTIDEINPGSISPGEFAHRVCSAVTGSDGEPARIVVIDSLSGYSNAMPEERFLTIQLHEILTFLGSRGVVTFLILAQHGLLSETLADHVDTSYLADVVLLLRYFEARGEIRKAISVIKKRSGVHEHTIRELSMKGGKIALSEPLTQFEGILRGAPQFYGDAALLSNADNE